MNYGKIIRVDMDPPSMTGQSTSAQVQGFLHEELQELEQVVRQGGARLAMFTLPSWFHKAKEAAVTKVVPPSGDALFHQKVQADMATMIALLNSMATSLAQMGGPSQALRPPEPAPASINTQGTSEVFYLVQPEQY